MGLMVKLFAALALAFALLCAVVPTSVHAQRRQDPRERHARELFEQGEAAYEEGRYEEAISAFEQAYGLSARPLLLYNIANAQERLGLLREALDNLNVYREDAPDDERAVLERRIRGLQDRVARQEREEAERRADQERIARTAAEAATAAVVRNGPGRGEPEGPPPPILGWTLTIGGSVLAATGVVFGVLALGARSDAAALCSDFGDLTLCPTSAASALSSDGTYSLLADIGVIVGAAAAAFGIYLVVTHDHESAPPARGPAVMGARAQRSEPRLELGVRPVAGGATVLFRATL